MQIVQGGADAGDRKTHLFARFFVCGEAAWSGEWKDDNPGHRAGTPSRARSASNTLRVHPKASLDDAIAVEVDVVLGEDLALLPGQRLLGERAAAPLRQHRLCGVVKKTHILWYYSRTWANSTAHQFSQHKTSSLRTPDPK